MHQSIPVRDLPNGKSIYKDCGGTFSHQHPEEPWWCERHATVEEAWQCYLRQAQEAVQRDQTNSPS